MANLEETAKWEEGVYQWETDDPVVGGPDGIDNVPTRQLANRTGYLKTQIEAHAAATDPHPQYLQQSEGDSLYDKTGTAAASMAGHLTATDPHPQYLQQAEGDTLYDKTGAASASMAGHVAATDPHPQYLTETEAAALIQQGTTAPQFDNSTKNATTAFVQRALGNFSAYTMITAAATTLTAAQTGGCFLVNAASAVVTLPNAAQSNLTYTLYAGSAFTLTTPSGSIIGPNSSSASVSVAAHGSIKVVFDGGNWEIIGGSAVAPLMVATPAQFDGTNLIATTAFVQRALGNHSTVSSVVASTALTAAYAGQYIVAYSTTQFTITLPAVTSVLAGTSFQIYNASATTHIVATIGKSYLYGSGVFNGATVNLDGYCGYTITSDGANWLVSSSQYTATPTSSSLLTRVVNIDYLRNQFLGVFSASGYQKLTSGMIIQWGKTYAPDDTYTQITFPIAFPTACVSVTANPETTGAVSGGNSIGVCIGGITTTTFNAGVALYNTAPSTGYIFWMAMGY